MGVVTSGFIVLLQALQVHADAGRAEVVDAGVRFLLKLLAV